MDLFMCPSHNISNLVLFVELAGVSLLLLSPHTHRLPQPHAVLGGMGQQADPVLWYLINTGYT